MLAEPPVTHPLLRCRQLPLRARYRHEARVYPLGGRVHQQPSPLCHEAQVDRSGCSQAPSRSHSG